MKPKTLMILAGITLVVILGATFFGQERKDKPIQSGEYLFPDLMARINEIVEMTIETKEATVTLLHKGNAWTVKEKGGYIADLEKIKPALIGMAELRIREPKTKNPNLYEKLGLQDKDAEGSSSTLITLKTQGGTAIATLILGNQRPGKGTPGKSDMYIRKPEDPQTWLVSGKLPIEKVAGEWLQKDLLKIASKRIYQVRVTHSDGETLTVYKDTPDALDFKIRDLQKDKKISSQFNVNNVATSLAQLEMEDVKKADGVEFSSKSGVQAVVETFDGLRLTVETMSQGETIQSRITPSFDAALLYKEPNSEKAEADSQTSEEGEKKASEPKSSVLKSEEDVQKEVTALKTKFSDWIFEIPKFRADNFSKKKSDLISKE